MKKIKKLTLLLGVALTLLTPVLGLIPPTQGSASAAPSDEVAIGDQVKSYISYRAIAHCILVSGLADKEDGAWESYTRVDENHAANFEWFAGGWGDKETSTWVGYLDNDDGNGKSSCHDSVLLQDAYSIWQLGGSSDGITSICYSGFQREGEEFENDTPQECIQGTSDQFVRPNKDKVKAANVFLASVRDQFYGGKEPVLTDAMRWYLAYHSVQGLCDATKRDNPQDYSDDQINDNDRLVYMIGPDGTKEVWALGNDFDEGKDVTIGTNSDVSDRSKKSCGDLAKDAANSTYARAYGDWVDDHPELAAQDQNNIEGGDELDVKCANEWSLGSLTNPLDWLSCNLLKGMIDASRAFDAAIAGMLCVDESSIFPGAQATCDGIGSSTEDSASAFHDAWNVFRILALGLLAIGGLVMVISQGLGFEIFDAYTVKKTLPRIIVAAIGISLSWQLLQFLVTLSNGLGIGVRALIYGPFQSSGIGINPDILGGGELAITTLFAGGAFVALGAIGLLSFIGTALLAILIAFITLIVRNMLIILLILAAPIAIAAYILPNTEKYYKTWWDWLLKALLVFPIITAFIAIGHVLAAITSTNGNTIASFVAFGAYFAPYFLIPATFRFAGGLMATLGGFANDRSRGGFDRLKKFRAGKASYNAQRLKDGERFNNAALNRMSARTTTKRFGLGRQGQAAYEQKLALAGASFGKSAPGEALQHNDDALRALTYESETQARQRMAQDWGMGQPRIDEAIAAAKASGGFGRSRQVYAAKQLSMTGTGYDNLQQVAETVARVSNGNEGMINDLAGNINSTTKAQGRFDLAPGYANLVGLSQGAANGSVNMADYHAATVAASRGADAVTVLRGKPQEVGNLTNSLSDHARAQHLRIQNAHTNAERRAATDEFLATMGQIDQLNQGKSYASVENQTHVNNLLDDTQDLRQQLSDLIGRTPLAPGPGGNPVADPRFNQSSLTQEQINNRERYNQTSVPRYNPNDPNNQS